MVKKTLLSMAIAAAVVSLAGCNVSTTDKYDNSVNLTPAESGQPGHANSRPAKAVSAVFSASTSKVPLAIDFLFADAKTSDGTANTADTSPPVTTAINKLDGFSTVAPVYIEFDGELNADTVVPGQTVFLVRLLNAQDDASIDALDMDTIVKASMDRTGANQGNPMVELAKFDADYITLLDKNGNEVPHIRILPVEPLQSKTKYLVIVTDGVKDKANDAVFPSSEYESLATVKADIDMPAVALNAVRDAIQGWQQLANGFLAANEVPNKSILSYTFTTGGVQDVLHSMAAPGTFMAKQLPTIAHAEGAISEKTIATALGQGADQEAADAAAAATLLQIAQGTAQKINAAMGAEVVPVDADTRTNLMASAQLAPKYYAGLISVIADGQGKGLDAIVDKPKSRAYNPIKLPADFGGAAVEVTYDDFFEGAVKDEVVEVATPLVTQGVEAQITDIPTGEGAITQAILTGPGPDNTQAHVDGALDQIAGKVAVAINAEAPGTLASEDGATVRPALKSNPALQPYYLDGLKQAIIKTKVAEQVAIQVGPKVLALSSKGSIYQGGLTIPNYLPASEADKADGELGTWIANEKAAKALGLDAAPKDVNGSTNVTYRFPFAENLGDITIPVFATLPSTSKCGPKPTDGWPVAIYQHGITVDRTAGVLVGNSLASACVAMVAIDHTMHGVAPGNATDLLFSVEKVDASVNLQNPATYPASPFAAVRTVTVAADTDNWIKDLHERHNNVGKNTAQENVAMVFKNVKGVTAEADVGASGDLYINLQNFARTRDAMRQTVLDLMNLNASIDKMDVDGNGTADDLDPSKVYFVGHSLGGIIGTTFIAVNNDPMVQTLNGNLPEIKAAILGNAGGGVVKLLENSPTIGSKVLPGLKAAAGLDQGSADIEKFFGVMQAMVDSADPINFASAAHMQALPILSYTAVDDLVVPNQALSAIKYKLVKDANGDDVPEPIMVDGATVSAHAAAKSYLSGTAPLDSVLGITEVVKGSTTAPAVMETRISIRTDAEKSTHSTFSNAKPADTFKEIYTQIGSFLSPGTTIPGGPLKGIAVIDATVLDQAE